MEDYRVEHPTYTLSVYSEATLDPALTDTTSRCCNTHRQSSMFCEICRQKFNRWYEEAGITESDNETLGKQELPETLVQTCHQHTKNNQKAVCVHERLEIAKYKQACLSRTNPGNIRERPRLQ